jgi:hypothetical protein
MSIRSFFNKLAEKREEKRKYKVLAAAIRANDHDGVKAALDAGADAGYFPGGKKNMPLHLALRQGNTEIFETLLNTDKGKMSAFFWHYDFRRFNKTHEVEKQIYFLPSLLYAAIEEKREDMALLLVKTPLVDLEHSGELMKAGGSLLPNAPEYNQLIKPADFARQQGLARVADAIAEKLKPVLAERAQAEADKLSAQAEQKRAEAEKLLREAEALQPAKPAGPKPGFKL